MSEQYFEGQPEGEWDDRGNLSWNEFDWRQFLGRHDQEVARFCQLYAQLRDHPERLDEAAHQMGWDPTDWSVSDLTMDEEEGNPEKSESAESREEDLDPYTVHRHPVYVVVRALYHDLHRFWEAIAESEFATRQPATIWRYAGSLHEGERHVILAINALDMGDYALAVCQMKFALESINQTFQILPHLLRQTTSGANTFQVESQLRLFDLREVSLRVMSDCREELRRSWGDRENDE